LFEGGKGEKGGGREKRKKHNSCYNVTILIIERIGFLISSQKNSFLAILAIA